MFLFTEENWNEAPLGRLLTFFDTATEAVISYLETTKSTLNVNGYLYSLSKERKVGKEYINTLIYLLREKFTLLESKLEVKISNSEMIKIWTKAVYCDKIIYVFSTIDDVYLPHLPIDNLLDHRCPDEVIINYLAEMKLDVHTEGYLYRCGLAVSKEGKYSVGSSYMTKEKINVYNYLTQAHHKILRYDNKIEITGEHNICWDLNSV